jgi:hypothetical protein
MAVSGQLKNKQGLGMLYIHLTNVINWPIQPAGIYFLSSHHRNNGGA